MAAVGFEETINNFIHSKTGEKIYLDIATVNVIQLRPLSKRGSVSLGSFWVHVFQHPNNYPVHSYPYKKLYKAGSEYELKLRIDGLSIIINLATGCLILRGPHVIDWFASRFLGILDGFSSPPGHSSKELKEHYTEAEMVALKKQKENYYKRAIEIWPDNVLHEDTNVMEAGTQNIYHEPSNQEGFLKGEDLESYSPIADLLDFQETVQQIEKLESGRVIQGNVLYRLWKSALNLWFSDKDGRVFIVTPHIDCDRLFDVCSLFLNHKLTACLDTMCVPLSNLHGRFAKVRSETIKRFLPRDQVFIEYKVYSSVIYPVVDFMNSFVVFVKDGKAKVLQTNTNFDRASFLTCASVSVQYKEIEEKQFLEAYLDPIIR